ncbi:hypothetical protein JTE90_019750 [Oedothorax gibbosus]|uniref:Myosin tail domain-containing protein n=1 Tax=Oedothorax gibbosus TaxID=931172 RepID=A0AAV6UP00_9ARAC|nr:hypothetical protein JTE90_019750 [Oedothorax gibbosus]
MPGSTASDPPKAKVTSETNSIFVRPVAVAGIFCPPANDAPPALPEKRRFSTLLGELRPVSVGETPGADDFARRRQSWDSRQKEVPGFGQALLRRTPKNPPALTSRGEDLDNNKNGISVTDKSVRDVDVKRSSETSNENSLPSVKQPDTHIKSDIRESTIKTISTNNAEDANQSNSFKCNSEIELKQNEACVVDNSNKQSKTVKSDVGREKVLQNKNVNKPYSAVSDSVTGGKVDSEVTCESKIVSNESVKTKKVFGLIKREPKPDTPTVKCDSASETNVEASLKNKVYGLNKASIKNNFDTEGLENNTKKLEKKIEVPSSKTQILPETNIVTEPSTSDRRNCFSPSPPKDVRTVRRTSGVIAAKIQNMFSNFQQDKPLPALPKKTKVLDKVNSPISKVSSHCSESEKENNSKTTSAANHNSETKVSDSKNVPQKENFPTLNDSSIKPAIIIKENSNVSLSKVGSSLKQNSAANSIGNGEVSQRTKLSSKKDYKTESSINGGASKQLNKKVDSIEGKMPIKKEDASSSVGTKPILTATNQESDRKSPSTSSDVLQGAAKSNQFVGCTTQQTSTVSDEDYLKLISQNLKIITSKATTSQSSIRAIQASSPSGQQSVSRETSAASSNQNSEISKLFVNGNAVNSESSKIEITKLTPSTQPSGAVHTVNVLFRTKSPQLANNKDENRKKVVIETTSNTAPIASTVLISPKLPDTSQICNTEQSDNATLRTVENIKVSLNSPQVSKKHTIVNLQKQEVAVVDLSTKKHPPVSVPSKTETSLILNQTPKEFCAAEISSNTDNYLKMLPKEPTFSSPTYMTRVSSTETVTSNTKKMEFTNNNTFSSVAGASMSVVDLSDWNKKFQRIEPEAPKAPLRRRAFRDSLPPSLPLRTLSSYGSGSLKRFEDSPRYVPRSPSQSSLPHRYSYTEMLSKVCSMGVLPSVEPVMSKSCSSSSSQVSELWSELSEEQSTATHASEMLEAETTERMRLEKEVHELQNRYSQIQHRSDKMEMEIMESRVYRTSELNGDLSEDEDPDGSGSIYKQKYERAVRDMEMMKRRFQQQHEEEMEQKAILKKASDKRLAEALEDVDEERQVANQWKRKAQKCGAELQDIRLMLEEQMARNGELEKKQRRFDAELSAAQEEIKKEKTVREKLMREKDQIVHEKYSLEQDLQATKIDSDMLHEKITQLNRELDELTLSSKGEEEVTQLKRAKQELERKTRDQEEELEELAAQVGMLEQAKLRLEMSLEKVRQEHRREASVREEEIEEIRASFSKKIKNLEAQLESEQDERHQLVKQKHELERRLYEIADQPPPHDPEIERRLRRDLKRTKALLRDAQAMLEHTREGQSSKTLIRQLKNQLEDSEFAKATAIKARQAVETELQDCQHQLEEVTRTKNEAETRCLQLSREKSAIQTQLEEAEEEMAEVMKKYKAVVAQMSADQKSLAEQNQQIAELETERQMLKDQLSEVSHKFEHLAGQSDDAHKVHWLDSKIRDLESKLELEQTTKSRLEHQISRLKEQNDRAREECDTLRNKELQAQEAVRRLQRQIRDSREDYSALQQKEADAYRKQHELEMALENTETDLQVTKNDLRLACQRIQDLQNALEDDLDSGTDVPDDSGSDSDSSFELSVLRNSSVTPTMQRCESIASNFSYDTEGPRSRTASFTQELSAFSRMMLKRSSMDFLG